MKNVLINVTWSVVTAVLLLGLYEGFRWVYCRLARKVARKRTWDQILGWVIAAALIVPLVESCPNLLDR